MSPETEPIKSPARLRAIAHPVRLRLYEVLMAGGPANGAQLARYVPSAPGSLSYHLRQLALHGFVEEAPELASDGRTRMWRAVPGGAHWEQEDLDANDAIREVANAAQLVFLDRQQSRLKTWLRRDAHDFAKEWRSAAFSRDIALHLDAEELAVLSAELDEVMEKWVARSRSNRQSARADSRRPTRDESYLGSTTTDGREAVMVALHAFPFKLADDDEANPAPRSRA